jgi:hypothetical protein
LELRLQKTASGEFKLDIKGLQQRTIAPAGDNSRPTTVYIDPKDETFVAKMMKFLDETEDARQSST